MHPVKQQALILCTGNSCRSQMAEGLINHFLGETWHAVSAGTAPSGYVHPLAIRAMAEVGIDISAAVSKSANHFRNADFTAVITVCDDAAENCPLWLGDGHIVHIGVEDPAQATGNEAEKMAVFRRVRGEIRDRVLSCLGEWDDAGSSVPKRAQDNRS